MTHTDIGLAEISLTQGLFVEGWQMRDSYLKIIHKNTALGIHVLFEDETAIASCIIEFETNGLHVFVKDAYRGLGYGQRVLAEALHKYNKTAYDVYGMEGIEGSDKFYQSCGIAYFADGCFSMKGDEVQLMIERKICFQDVRERRIKEYLEDMSTLSLT